MTAPQQPVETESSASLEEKRFEKPPVSTADESALDKNWWISPPTEAEQGKASSSPAHESSPVSIAPFLTLFALLLLFYSLVAMNHLARPERLENVLRWIPWVGSSVLKNDHLKRGIILESVVAHYQTIRGNREVLVISGSAVNRNPMSVREVRLEGVIFNGEGKQIDHQVISVGNPISAKIIRDVEAKELSILQGLSPQRRFEIPPEQSAPFLIAFLKPTKEIKSFSYRVVSAEEGT
jgi:hypothetical protein